MAVKIDLNKSGTGIIYNGVEISFFILDQIINTESRTLFRFKKDGKAITVQGYGEHSVIWIEDEDLERDEKAL